MIPIHPVTGTKIFMCNFIIPHESVEQTLNESLPSFIIYVYLSPFTLFYDS